MKIVTSKANNRLILDSLIINNYISIYIQKCWRGYRARCIVNNIYINLPYDIQRIIKYKVNYNLYIDKYNNSVLKIVNNRVTILNELLENICIYDLNTIYNNIETILEYIKTYAKYYNYINRSYRYITNKKLGYVYNILNTILTEEIYKIDITNYKQYISFFSNNEYDEEYVRYLNVKNELLLMTGLFSIDYMFAFYDNNDNFVNYNDNNI